MLAELPSREDADKVCTVARQAREGTTEHSISVLESRFMLNRGAGKVAVIHGDIVTLAILFSLAHPRNRIKPQILAPCLFFERVRQVYRAFTIEHAW